MAQEPENYAVAIIVETPDGIPLVSDPQKPEPRFWKFPGGRSQPGEKPVETAIRELKEETAISLREDELKMVHQEIRSSSEGQHSFFLFRANISKAIELPERGSDGELVKFFTPEEIKTMPDFFPPHRALAEKFILKK